MSLVWTRRSSSYRLCFRALRPASPRGRGLGEAVPCGTPPGAALQPGAPTAAPVSFCQGCGNRVPRTGWSARECIFSQSGGWMCKVKVSAGLVSSAASLLGFRVPASLCLHGPSLRARLGPNRLSEGHQSHRTGVCPDELIVPSSPLERLCLQIASRGTWR